MKDLKQNLKQLQKKRDEANARANAVVTAVGENLMTEEQSTEFNAAVAERKQYDAQIAAFREQMESDRTTDAVAQGFDAQVGKNHAEDKPWASFGEQLRAVFNYSVSGRRNADPRLFAYLGQNETVDAEGGFLVAPEYSGTLLTRTFEEGQVTSRCDTMPMSSPHLVINGIADDNRVGGYLGAGILVGRAAEAASFNKSLLKFRRVDFNVNKLMGFFYATDEILADAPALESRISQYFPKAFAWQLDNEALNGTGSGQFLGINASGVVLVTPKQASQASGSKLVVTQNFLDMRARLWLGSRPNAVWFVGPDVEDTLFSLTIPGPQGTAVALYTPPGFNGNANKYGMVLGCPVVPIEQTAPYGTQGDIILADMTQYTIGDHGGIKAASSMHVAFQTDEMAFRWTLRNDGKPLWDKPVTQNNSANKVSPFVTLQTR